MNKVIQTSSVLNSCNTYACDFITLAGMSHLKINIKDQIADITARTLTNILLIYIKL